MRQLMLFFVAVGVIALFVAGIVWGVESEQPRDSGSIVKLTYGPEREQFAFKAPVKGLDGPLGRCVVCHNIEKNGAPRVAPDLWGIVGAHKARAEWFAYSHALKQAKGSWTEKDLDEYLTKPSKFLPGTAKTLVGIPDKKERADIIAELKKLKD